MTVLARTSETMIPTSGGLRIFIRSWRPETRPRAVVAIVHGFNSHSGYYTWAAEQFVSRGLAVYALDLRGRGRSDGERFYIESIAGLPRATWTRSSTLAKSREPGLPLFLLGHSAGGVISSHLHARASGQLAGLICESFAFQVYGAGFRAGRRQGAEPPGAARARAQAEERGLLARPGGGAGHERGSADRRRGPADADRRGAGARRRAAEARVPAHHAARADPARHRRQGDQADRQPALLRQRRVDRQDAEALHGTRARSAERRRQARR